MAKKWTHPNLGEFASSKDGDGWHQKRNVPAFATFCYDTGYSNARRSTGDITLTLSPWLCNTKLEAPTPAMVSVAEKIFADPDMFVQRVVAALWEDFNGRGPDSRYWWHGNMKSIRATFEGEKLPPPTRAQDLLQVLQLYNVMVCDGSSEFPSEPIAWLQFHAAYEQEHGVSVLSDGNEILGAGYSGEATPWKTNQVT